MTDYCNKRENIGALVFSRHKIFGSMREHRVIGVIEKRDKRHGQGMFRLFSENAGPILFWKVIRLNHTQGDYMAPGKSMNSRKFKIGSSGNEYRKRVRTLEDN